MDHGRSPPAPHGWKSASQLAELGYVGGRRVIERKMRKLQERLIKEKQDAGLAEEEAVEHIENTVIGTKKPGRGPSTLHASSEAVEMLGLRHRDQPVARGSRETWKSAYDLTQDYQAARPTIVRRLKKLRSSLLRLFVTKGMEIGAAERKVIDEFIDEREKRFDCEPVMYASPEAVQLLERDGLARRKWSHSLQRTRDGEPKSPSL